MHFDHLRHKSIKFQNTQHLSSSVQTINQMLHVRCDKTTSEIFYFPLHCWCIGKTKSQVSCSENSSNNPNPKWPRLAFSLQQPIPPPVLCLHTALCNELTCVFSFWPTWKASWDKNKNQGQPRTGFQNKALLSNSFLRWS